MLPRLNRAQLTWHQALLGQTAFMVARALVNPEAYRAVGLDPGRDLERDGVAVRDRSEIAALHGADGRLEAVTLTTGERLPFSFLFLFLGAQPCTDWLGDTVARDANGFILTGADANADHLLQTSVPGIYAAGDARSGSTKRCATAVGEGSMAVAFVHAHLARTPAASE